MLSIVPVDVSKMGMVLLNNSVSLIPLTILIFPLGEYKPEKLHPSDWLLRGQ